MFREEDIDLAKRRRKKNEPANRIQIRWLNKEEDLEFVTILADRIISGRRGIYEDNWALMSLDSLLSGAMYKVDRARITQDLLKQLDDVLDAINYLRFSAIRILKQIDDRKLRLPY
jgi:hypothetical protein